MIGFFTDKIILIRCRPGARDAYGVPVLVEQPPVELWGWVTAGTTETSDDRNQLEYTIRLDAGLDITAADQVIFPVPNTGTIARGSILAPPVQYRSPYEVITGTRLRVRVVDAP